MIENYQFYNEKKDIFPPNSYWEKGWNGTVVNIEYNSINKNKTNLHF